MKRILCIKHTSLLRWQHKSLQPSQFCDYSGGSLLIASDRFLHEHRTPQSDRFLHGHRKYPSVCGCGGHEKKKQLKRSLMMKSIGLSDFHAITAQRASTDYSPFSSTEWSRMEPEKISPPTLSFSVLSQQVTGARRSPDGYQEVLCIEKNNNILITT